MSNDGCTKCALCEEGEDLQLSHIVPSLIVNWLRDSSGTGFLRGATGKNIRIQDAPKMRLLCSRCEVKLSRFEKYFAEAVFFPYQNKAVKRFSYDESLLKFVVSMGWRILQSDLDSLRRRSPHLMAYAKQALRTWGDFMLGLREDEGENEHHLFFLDFVQDSSMDIVPNFQWYTLRAIDGCLAIGQERALSYTKFPGMLLVSAVHPPRLDGWVGTRIARGVGEIGPPQEIAYPGFWEFLVDRVERSFESNVSKIQERRIEKTIRSNPDRMLSSKSFEVFLAERKQKRVPRKQRLPKSVAELIEVVEESGMDLSLPQMEKNSQMGRIALIADRLADLDTTAAKLLDTDIVRNTETARRASKEVLTATDLGDVVVIFLTTLGSKRAERNARISEVSEDINRNRSYPMAKLILIFVWDPTDLSDMVFSWGCLFR